MPVFNAGKLLQDNGYNLLGSTDTNGVYEVTDSEGNRKKLNLNRLAADQGIKDPVFNLNDPTSAVEISPISIVDRFKMKSLGNEEGQVQYLRKNYGEVAVDPTNGLVVKHNGVWHQADPGFSMMGNEKYSWTDKIAELAKDTADMGDVIAKGYGAMQGAAAGAAAGASVGAAFAGVGAIPGAVAGSIIGSGIGGAAVEFGRTLMGKAVETYAGDAKQIATDVGVEFLLNAGGQGAVTKLFGVKALHATAGTNGAKILKEAIENIKKTATPETMGLIKQTAVELIGKSNGAGPKVVEDMFNYTDDVGAMVKQYSKLAPSVREAAIKTQQLTNMTEFYDTAQSSLVEKYGKLLSELVDQADGSGLKINFKELHKDISQQLANEGLAVVQYAKPIEQAGMRGLDEAGNQMGQAAAKAGKYILRAPTELQAGRIAAAGVEADAAIPEVKSAIDDIYKGMNKYMQGLGTAEDGNAAALAMRARKHLNEIFRQKTATLAPGSAPERMLNRIREIYATSIEGKFADAGLSEPLAQTSQLYERFADEVHYLGRSFSDKADPNAGFTFLNQVLSKNPASGIPRKDAVKILTELTGNRGAALVHHTNMLEAGRVFSTWIPSGIGGKLVGAAALGAGSLGAVPAMLAAPVAVATSPRGLLYATKTLKAMGKMNAPELLKNPDALRSMIPFLFDQSNNEQQMSDAMIQEALGGQNGQSQ